MTIRLQVLRGLTSVYGHTRPHDTTCAACGGGQASELKMIGLCGERDGELVGALVVRGVCATCKDRDDAYLLAALDTPESYPDAGRSAKPTAATPQG